MHTGVCAKDLMTDLAAEENLALMLADGGDVARPELEFVLR